MARGGVSKALPLFVSRHFPAPRAKLVPDIPMGRAMLTSSAFTPAG